MKLAAKRRSDLPLVAHADFAWLMSLLDQRKDRNGNTVIGETGGEEGSVRGNGVEIGRQLDIIRRAIPNYENST